MDENVKYDLFDDYTKSVTKKILSIKKSREIRAELFSHLIEDYERFRGLGKNHTEAQEQALNLMGDKEIITEQFGELYSVSPSDYLGSAFTYLIFGILLSSFQIDFFMGAREIVLFIGQALLLYALVCLRKADKMFDIATKLCVSKFAFTIVIQTMIMILKDSHDYILSWALVDLAFNLILFGIIFVGIYNLFEKLEHEVKKPNLILGFIFYFLYSATLMISYIFEGDTYIVFLTPLLLIVSIVVVMKCQLALCSNDNEIDLSGTATSHEKIICWVIVFAVAILPMIPMVAISCSQPKTSIFEVTDTEASAEVISSSRDIMLKLGFPKEYLADLPDSEVLKYKEALHLEVLGKKSYSPVNYYVFGDFTFNTETFVFYFPYGEIRTLIRLELPDETKINFRNGLYYESGYKTMGDNGNDDLNLVLCDINDKTVSSKILSAYTENDSHLYDVAGFEFKFPRNSTNRRAYLGKNSLMHYPDSSLYSFYDATFICEGFPIKTELQSINSTALDYFNHGNSMLQFMGCFTNETVKSYQIGQNYEYKPEWAGYETEE